MSNVADVSGEEATKGITSIIKGFNLDVADAEHVADILISVGQSYAVSASEMMEAYEKSGAALNATNTSLEKSAGLIAAANSSVQDASVIGTALKTVSARIRGKNFCASIHSNMYAQARYAA
jgi:TP901 family phage tail tape measure protein